MSGRPATTAETAVSYFSTPAVDHAVAGVVAGTVSTLCMNPLDLLKTRFGKQTVLMSPERPSYVSLQIVGDPGW